MDEERAYADAVGAVLDAVPRDAEQRFDAALDEMVSAGRLHAQDARRLRWLQRVSSRVVREHAAEALPSLIGGLVRGAAQVNRPSASEQAREEPVSQPPVGAPTVTDPHRRRLIVAGLRAADPTPRRPA